MYACIKYITFIFDYISSILKVVYTSNHIAICGLRYGWVYIYIYIYMYYSANFSMTVHFVPHHRTQFQCEVRRRTFAC